MADRVIAAVSGQACNFRSLDNPIFTPTPRQPSTPTPRQPSIFPHPLHNPVSLRPHLHNPVFTPTPTQNPAFTPTPTQLPPQDNPASTPTERDCLDVLKTLLLVVRQPGLEEDGVDPVLGVEQRHVAVDLHKEVHTLVPLFEVCVVA